MSTQWTEEDQRAADDRVSWALWEENHYPHDTSREQIIVERCVDAGYVREEDQ